MKLEKLEGLEKPDEGLVERVESAGILPEHKEAFAKVITYSDTFSEFEENYRKFAFQGYLHNGGPGGQILGGIFQFYINTVDGPSQYIEYTEDKGIPDWLRLVVLLGEGYPSQMEICFNSIQEDIESINDYLRDSFKPIVDKLKFRQEDFKDKDFKLRDGGEISLYCVKRWLEATKPD